MSVVGQRIIQNLEKINEQRRELEALAKKYDDLKAEALAARDVYDVKFREAAEVAKALDTDVQLFDAQADQDPAEKETIEAARTEFKRLAQQAFEKQITKLKEALKEAYTTAKSQQAEKKEAAAEYDGMPMMPKANA